jgi:purine-binding chemotaxis protein CheW
MTTTHNSVMSSMLPLLTFRLGDQQYGLAIAEVIEVAAMVDYLRVTGQSPEILGIINRRGMPLPLLDLRLVFGQGGEEIDASTLFIVAAPAHQLSQQVALVVDEVHQVEYVDGVMTPPPSPSGAQFIQGIVNHKSQLIQLVAVAALVRAYVHTAEAVKA